MQDLGESFFLSINQTFTMSMSICANIDDHTLKAKVLLGGHDIDCAEKVVKELCKICNKPQFKENDLCKAIARADSTSSTFQAMGCPKNTTCFKNPDWPANYI